MISSRVTRESKFLPTLPARGATASKSGMPPVEGAFLSTLPARGATTAGLAARDSNHDFYPRSPRGERQKTTMTREDAIKFLPTLPARGATDDLFKRNPGVKSATHARRAGSDGKQIRGDTAEGGVNI